VSAGVKASVTAANAATCTATLASAATLVMGAVAQMVVLDRAIAGVVHVATVEERPVAALDTARQPVDMRGMLATTLSGAADGTSMGSLALAHCWGKLFQTRRRRTRCCAILRPDRRGSRRPTTPILRWHRGRSIHAQAPRREPTPGIRAGVRLFVRIIAVARVATVREPSIRRRR
jgi:hypothetical protein